jgi:hypothetical protein
VKQSFAVRIRSRHRLSCRLLFDPVEAQRQTHSWSRETQVNMVLKETAKVAGSAFCLTSSEVEQNQGASFLATFWKFYEVKPSIPTPSSSFPI